ncbi:TolC family protein [uncultured Rubinisphaera sp.]|uniref:TolC family protein n=1 Tax=uncultured Rubinisphaera sp. TaxID=1678686 RepID=UPI0030DB4142
MPARFLYFVLLLGIAGCSASDKLNFVVTNEKPRVRPPERVVASAEDSSSIVLLGLKEDSQPQQIQTTESLSIDEAFITNENTSIARSDSNSERIYLESLAADQDPKLIRLYREYQAAASRSHYVDKLPDPKLGANVFGNPIVTASGSQQAYMSLSQTIPWLSRLNAEQQRACFEAMAIRAEYAAERLRVIAAVQTQRARLYLIEQQIEITQANQSLLESLIDVANSRVAIGKASQGDVLLGTVEY